MEIENKTVESIPAVTIRFAGDSGDGMQLVGTRFTDTSAIFGNDLATLPAFPAEIRAPQGTIAGVSSFQVQIADFDILTPGEMLLKKKILQKLDIKLIQDNLVN